MKRIFITTLIFAAFGFAEIQNINGQTGGDNAKLEGEVGKILRDYYDAFGRRDIAATSAIYADDGFVYEGGYSTNVQIKAEIRAYLQSAAASSKYSCQMERFKGVVRDR